MLKKITKEDLKGIPFDTFGKNKKGNYIIRKGFYYTHGQTAEKIAEKVLEKFPEVEIINTFCYWKPFRGGSTVAQGSHFFVEFKLKELS